MPTSLLTQNIGTQSVQELFFFCDRSIRRTVYSNDLLRLVFTSDGVGVGVVVGVVRALMT